MLTMLSLEMIKVYSVENLFEFSFSYMKDFGLLMYFLGIGVARSSKDLFLSQRKYFIDLLGKNGTLGSKPIDTPMDPNIRFDQT